MTSSSFVVLRAICGSHTVVSRLAICAGHSERFIIGSRLSVNAQEDLVVV